MKYKILEHTADIMFEVYGKSLNKLFTNAAIATFDVMVKRSSINPKIKKEINLENKDIEKLLFEFIEELIYLKDAEYLVFKSFKVKIKRSNLKAIVEGEKINSKKHKLLLDVKAITLHKYRLSKTKDGYKATILLDI